MYVTISRKKKTASFSLALFSTFFLFIRDLYNFKIKIIYNITNGVYTNLLVFAHDLS